MDFININEYINYCLWSCSLDVPVLARWVMVLWFYVQEHPKAQPAVVLVLKGLSLKSHPTDWEKPGIKPATPGLQDIGLSPTRFCFSWV